MTLGSILREHGAAFFQQFPQPPGVERTLRNLAACRTAALGGHVTVCGHCGDVAYHYHSCGDRHCPQCGGNKRLAWLEKQQACLLAVPYFHVVFTLPHQLSALILGNRKLLYNLLFSAASETLLELGGDEKYLGAKIGTLMVLHTWGQQLEHHPHVHCIVPNGGLSLDDTEWVMGSRKFFLPVKVMAKLFRGKYLEELRQLNVKGELEFSGSTSELADPEEWKAFIAELYKTNWITYAKKPFGGPEQVLNYLAGYTHRVALSNRRILAVSDTHVTLSYKDYADGCAQKELNLEINEFLRRFSMHVQVGGFVRIRQYGILSYRDRLERLARCRELIANRQPQIESTEKAFLFGKICLLIMSLMTMGGSENGSVSPLKLSTCLKCGGPLHTQWSAERPTSRELESNWRWDTS